MQRYNVEQAKNYLREYSFMKNKLVDNYQEIKKLQPLTGGMNGMKPFWYFTKFDAP